VTASATVARSMIALARSSTRVLVFPDRGRVATLERMEEKLVADSFVYRKISQVAALPRRRTSR
jgi:hypothetical protein